MWWFLSGWCAGWLMLAVPRPLPQPLGPVRRRPVAVVIPARDESAAIAHVVAALAVQQRPGDELIVVDDHSTDDTAALAAANGARVVAAGDFSPTTWLGKPHACFVGAQASTAPLLVFVDADVHPPVDLLDRLAVAVDREPASVISVQPWHETGGKGEQVGLLGNVVSLMGTGAFTPFRGRVAGTLAFGPVLAVDRSVYDAVGGHGNPGVRRTRVEDIALARAVGRSAVFTGRPDVRFRMYPQGLRQTFDGWTRTLAAGLGAAPAWAAIATAAWVWSLAGGWLGWSWAYPLSAVQVWVLGRRAGNLRWYSAVLYPVLVVVFVGAALRSVALRVSGREVSWKGRATRRSGRLRRRQR